MTIPDVGAYEWRQLSQWDFAPPVCVEKFERCGKHIFHYYLIRCTEQISPCHYKIEVVKTLDGVPAEILHIRDGDMIKERNLPCAS